MFTDLKKKIQDNYAKLSKNNLFYVSIDRDTIWDQYLNGFSEETKQGHNCNCCKSFIRQFGGIVSIVDGKTVSVWDVEDVEEEYQQSIKNLRKYIHSLPITDVFITDVVKAGTDKNKDGVRDVIWEHFSLIIDKKFVKNVDLIDSLKGTARDNQAVLKRALDELKIDASSTVLELISQNSLYKGKEFEGIIKQFNSLQEEYAKVPKGLKDNFVWVKSVEVTQALCRIRNSAIGTLLIDLSEGKDLDHAVTAFEKVVAPTNYKRPAAIITAKMVEEAQKEIEKLGYTEALNRRYASEQDLKIDDVIFTDKSSELSDVFKEMKKDVSVNPKSLTKVEEIGIEDFIKNVVPKSKSIEVLLENNHLNKMVSLITSDDENSMFKWSNPFSWSYTGGITDSMRERVVALGGRVDGVFRFTHSWNHDGNNQSLMDLHVFMPSSSIKPNKDKQSDNIYGSGRRVGWNNRNDAASKGVQDVDYTVPPGKNIPLENITFPSIDKMPEGDYVCKVHNWNLRPVTTSGFKAEIEVGGQIYSYDYAKPLGNKEWITVAVVTLKNKEFTIKHYLPENTSSKEKWNLKTNRFHKVKKFMYSPNYWKEQTGNKHYLFMLEDCISDESPRPFFNEFLKEDLITKNKRVFEVLAGKLKVPASSKQLSGVGFSDTIKDSMLCRVEGSFKRTIKVNF